MIPEKTFCCKCKAKTSNKNAKFELSKNNRYMMRTLCEDCDCKKVRFVSKDDYTKSGGSLAILGQLALPMAEKGLSQLDEIGSNLESRVDKRIKYLRGRGVGDEEMLRGVKLGIEAKQSGLKKLPSEKKIKKLMHGEGISGSGFFGDFVEGFAFGFTNPVKAIQLLANELDHAISGKGLEFHD